MKKHVNIDVLYASAGTGALTWWTYEAQHGAPTWLISALWLILIVSVLVLAFGDER